MAKAQISRAEVKQLYDEGLGVTQIAERLGYTKGAISKVLKQMNIEITKAVVTEAPKYLEQKDREAQRLDDMYARVLQLLDQLDTDNHEMRLKGIAEGRKIISEFKDMKYKMFKALVWAELLNKIDEAIANGCPSCQNRIRSVLQSL
jgi:predicted transcriptional regulator